MKTMVTAGQVRPNKVYIFIVVILLFMAGLFAFNNFLLRKPVSISSNVSVITQNGLEEKYGLRVNLVAVTAAGGMIDLRLKILDGEKAKLLLQDKKNFPTLLVGDNNLKISADEDTSSQEIKFEKNAGLFLLFPNTGNAVKSGSPIRIVFGTVQLEPVPVK